MCARTHLAHCSPGLGAALATDQGLHGKGPMKELLGLVELGCVGSGSWEGQRNPDMLADQVVGMHAWMCACVCVGGDSMYGKHEAVPWSLAV